MIDVDVGSFVAPVLRSSLSIATLYRVSAVYLAAALALCVWLQSHDRLSPSEHALPD